jgi:YD repeat-containing protein
VQRCVQARHGSGVRYGHIEDLQHNLIAIYRGNHKTAGNQPYLKNVYGPDPTQPDFDALIEQENLGHSQRVGIQYHFKGADPGVTYPSGNIDAYQPVLICPAPTAGAPSTLPPGAAQRGQGPVPVAQTKLVDPYGVSWTFFIGERGEILRTINAGTGAVRSFNYDAAGRLIGVEQPLGDRVCLGYDGDGNLVRRFSMPVPGAPVLFDHIRQELTYQRFPNGMFRLQTVADPRNPTKTLVRYGWDQFGNLMTVMDAEGFVTSFTPGRGGVPTQEVRPDVSIVRYQYERGALSGTTVDFAGPAPVMTSLTPDSAGRPSVGVGAFGERTEWVWEPGLDRLGQIIRRNDDKTETVTHKYNALGELEETSNGKRRTVFEYDPQGLLRRISDFAIDRTLPPLDIGDMLDPPPQPPRPDLGPRPVRVTCTRFGPSGRYLETVLPDGARLRYQYDGEGRVTAVEAGTLASDGSGWDRGCPRFTGPFAAAGIISSTVYDANGRPELIRDGRGQVTTLTYDGFGNPATLTDPGGTVTRQGFDQMGNVIWSATYGPGQAPANYRGPAEGDPGLLAAQDLEYDAVGRLHIQRRWHFDKDGRRLGRDGRATTTIIYDTARRRRPVTDDSGATTIFEWDGAGRPRRTEHPTGGVETTEYSRDGLSILRTVTAPTERGRVAEVLALTSWGAPARRISNVPLDRRPPEGPSA